MYFTLEIARRNITVTEPLPIVIPQPLLTVQVLNLETVLIGNNSSLNVSSHFKTFSFKIDTIDKLGKIYTNPHPKITIKMGVSDERRLWTNRTLTAQEIILTHAVETWTGTYKYQFFHVLHTLMVLVIGRKIQML